MADHQARPSRAIEQFISLFKQMQGLTQELRSQDAIALIQADPHLSQLQRHVFNELICDQASSFSLARDELTGLLLRSSLLECLNKALVDIYLRGNYLAVCFIDLDGFKEINDQHGHLVGDQALRLVSVCLKNSIRSEDLLCRWGGDEFVVVLQDITQKDFVLGLANRLLNAITSPLRLSADDPLTLFLGASIGVSMVEPRNFHQRKDALTLIESADEAMYSAKQAGKNQIQFAAL
ncbi:GGDEF domain-containing protein [Polynucleobacter sp. MWH-UH35A]|uniref:GGDEF domain-containing protein n=1 Tax=Polynucleobacter sp. MWH-UH35A TaxID=1855619 RepID=UPI001BFD9599|nr:GGDEF domain-containing protein [Polynucleobacter sp. MWH-UH35A]QWD59774.1 GGDEF domain-containing protein [Polynucleobacter sp. MWH-UH35A]